MTPRANSLPMLIDPHEDARYAAQAAELVPAKILVVDDDRRNLLAVNEILTAPGVGVVLAEGGEEALRHVLQEDFAVILLDVQMPRIDGYEVAAMIRSRPRSSRIPIIFLTAFDKDEMHVFRGYSAGAVDFVFKPIEPLILTSKVGVFVDLYRKTEEIRRQSEAERKLLVENLRVRGEKLRVEENLRRREEHQSLVLQSLPIALYTAAFGKDGHRPLFAGDAIQRITGFTAEAFAGDPGLFESRVDPEDLERVRGQLAALESQDGVTLDYRFRAADGSERYILDQAVLIGGEDAPREIFGIWLDVTERKVLEQSLTHASKLEAVGRLTGGIAHDFNNMLSVVIGNLDLLQRRLEGNEQAKQRVRMAIEGAERCADLTNRLLAFSRREPMQTAIVDLGEIVPGMMELIRRSIGERIEIALETGEDLPPVALDVAQFEAALLNLVVNARDAMPEGGRLAISLAQGLLPGGPAVVLSIADTGIGMSPEVQERVFEPFFTTKESGRGTGLGLSMVYGFVRQSKGEIRIVSAPGEGTRFDITLPAAAADGRPLRRAAPPPEAVPMRGNGETVLVVEDDPRVRQVTASTFRSLGFVVRETENGEEALASLSDDPAIDLVFTDVRMPGALDGTDLARRVLENWPGIKVLLTSGYVETDEGLGDFEIIYKPYRTAELAERVRDVLSREGENAVA